MIDWEQTDCYTSRRSESPNRIDDAAEHYRLVLARGSGKDFVDSVLRLALECFAALVPEVP
jgi:hypothetical protein